MVTCRPMECGSFSSPQNNKFHGKGGILGGINKKRNNTYSLGKIRRMEPRSHNLQSLNAYVHCSENNRREPDKMK